MNFKSYFNTWINTEVSGFNTICLCLATVILIYCFSFGVDELYHVVGYQPENQTCVTLSSISQPNTIHHVTLPILSVFTIFMFFVLALGEELVFRCYVLSLIAPQIKKLFPAMLIGSTVFGLAHGIDHAIAAFGAGVLLSIVYLKCGGMTAFKIRSEYTSRLLDPIDYQAIPHVIKALVCSTLTHCIYNYANIAIFAQTMYITFKLF